MALLALASWAKASSAPMRWAPTRWEPAPLLVANARQEPPFQASLFLEPQAMLPGKEAAAPQLLGRRLSEIAGVAALDAPAAAPALVALEQCSAVPGSSLSGQLVLQRFPPE